jgi:glycosyltransferase involved in cell wall biosynthesis
MKDLSIIMPFLNEKEEPKLTIESILETSDDIDFEIIVIDDNSDINCEIPKYNKIKSIKNKERIGVDGSRQLGVELANSNNIFIIDAHMRFNKGWMSKIIENINNESETIFCTTCVGLGYGNMDLTKANSKYRGATFVISNCKNEILEPKWKNNFNNGFYEIPCILGANYGMSKEWFNHIHGLSGLKMWGSSELFLSLKTWLAGGKCKIDTDIEIGHKFRDNAPYSTHVWNLTYNKILLCKLLFPKCLEEKVVSKMPKTLAYKEAMRQISNNKEFIKAEKEYLNKIFKKDIYDILEYLNINNY